VKAGLGTLGLNTMLLTPQFGPRVFLAGVLTDLDLEPDDALESDLCLGLQECGHCAAVCPEDAIPRRIPEDAAVADSRSLDAEACSRSSQPFGPRRMADHLKRIFKAEEAAEARAIAAEPVTMQLFHHLTVMKQGAFTGCVRCQTVCPVGDDFPTIEGSQAHCQLVPAEIRQTTSDGWVSVDSLVAQVP
jgi:ferredoxin